MVFLAPTRAKHRRAGKPSRPAKRADLAGLAPPGGAYCFRVDDTVFWWGGFEYENATGLTCGLKHEV